LTFFRPEQVIPVSGIEQKPKQSRETAPARALTPSGLAAIQASLEAPPAAQALQKISVEARNRYGWVIPFSQITVHTAGASAGE